MPEHPPDSSPLYIDAARLKRLQQWAAIASASQEEDDYLRRELNQQLQTMVVKVLDPRLDGALAAVEPATYGVPLPPHCALMREDVVEPWPDAEALLDRAPRVQDRYFVVPASEHEEL
jgi:Asp-tRNA(Asn)/Glu-tRNA(Gln) amidotransferase C subunit